MVPETTQSPGRRYTVEDLPALPDVLDWVRERPECFFWESGLSPCEAAVQIVREALQFGVPDVSVVQQGDWWYVWSSRDWLADTDAREVFRTLVRNPRGGPNNCYREVVVRAFASHMITQHQEHRDVVVGDVPPEFDEFARCVPPGGRIVGFRLHGD